MSYYDRVAQLALEIDRVELEPLALDNGGFVRRTTVVRLHGRGLVGVGEDVCWSSDDQQALQQRGTTLDLAGRTTFDEFSRGFDDFDLFPRAHGDSSNRLYRRWAFESAALDLALRQADTSLGAAIGREPEAVRFVVSGGLGQPASVEPVKRKLDRMPGLTFKLDWSPDWTAELVAQLAELACVFTVDLKGHYNTPIFAGPEPDPAGYRAVAAGLPDAWIEDAALTPATLDALAPYQDRLTWDAPIHALSDIVALPFKPKAVNMKPSRFGFVRELFDVYDYCHRNDIEMYGGGQYELGVGRGQIQALAALMHPSGVNDVAPVDYHAKQWADAMPTNPLPPNLCKTGFGME